MKSRIAMIGTGAVGAIHAANLAADPNVELVAVYNPDFAAASAFALQFGFRSVAHSLKDACGGADVAIVCSPPKYHFQQARACLEAGLHTLIELPACETVAEAVDLAHCAEQRGLHLGCTHTARYLQPYIFIGDYLRQGLAGAIKHVNYVRFPQLNPKVWIDHALAHHAAHILDMILDWFGDVDPIAATLQPDDENTRTASLLGRLAGGGYVAVTVSYDSHLPVNSLLIVGERRTLESDGFSFVRSDDGVLHQCAQQPVYESAIRNQDRAFLAACRGVGDYADWQDTIQLMRTVNRFRDVYRSQLNTEHDGSAH
jgi:2-hydroxy-4-carboxymuconate semialdehyde hemiacetal dehydrogenase